MPLIDAPQRACFHRILQRPRQLSDLLGDARADGFISGHITGIALSASARSRSFRFDPGILDHIGPFDELDLNELPEFFRRA